MSSPSPHPTHVHVDSFHSQDTVWVVIGGRADTPSVEELSAALGAIELDGARSVDLNLAGLESCDAAALAAITGFAALADGAGLEVRIRDATANVRTLARVVGVDGVWGLGSPVHR
jgi:ABC-type transporter Mla MlaB component